MQAIEIELGSVARKKPSTGTPKKKKLLIRKKTSPASVPATKSVPAPLSTKKTVKKIVKKADLHTKRGRVDAGDALAAEVEALQRDMPSLSGENQKQLDQYVHMFGKLQEVSLLLEEKILSTKTSRDVYPLMQTYNQMREVIADMRALRDVGALGQLVNDEVLHPFMQSVASRVVDLYKDTAQEINRMTADNPTLSSALIKVFEKQLAALGAGVNLDYQQSLDKSLRVLGG